MRSGGFVRGADCCRGGERGWLLCWRRKALHGRGRRAGGRRERKSVKGGAGGGRALGSKRSWIHASEDWPYYCTYFGHGCGQFAPVSRSSTAGPQRDPQRAERAVSGGLHRAGLCGGTVERSAEGGGWRVLLDGRIVCRGHTALYVPGGDSVARMKRVQARSRLNYTAGDRPAPNYLKRFVIESRNVVAF